MTGAMASEIFDFKRHVKKGIRLSSLLACTKRYRFKTFFAKERTKRLPEKRGGERGEGRGGRGGGGC